jgi:hypothetical protein
MFSRRLGIIAVLVALAASVPSSAQTPRPERAYRGLFGGNGANPNATRQLDFTVTFYGGYDDNLLANAADQGGGGQPLNDPRFQASGQLGGAQAGLDFTRRTRRSSVDISGGGAYRYYPTAGRFNGLNGWADGAFSVSLTPTTTLGASESVYYSPYYSLAQFSAVPDPGLQVERFFLNRDMALLEYPATTFLSTASLTHQVTPRASWALDYSLRYVNFRQAANSISDHNGGGTFTYRLNRQSSLHVGYHYRRGTLGLLLSDRRPVESHDVNIGIDYSRPLSPSRKTTFGLSTGSSIYRAAEEGYVSDARTETTNYGVTANVYLRREIGRSWSAQVEYSRGLQFIYGVGTPYFADNVSGRIYGFAGRRTRLSGWGTLSYGGLGLRSASNYGTFNTGARLQLAAARYVALYADYFFYHYKFDDRAPLPPGMARATDRNGVRVGLNLWQPLLR